MTRAFWIRSGTSMSHGVVIVEREPMGAWAFEFAASQEGGVCFFASQHFIEEVGTRGLRKPFWKDSFVRGVGRFGPDWSDTQYARYHPSWDRPFVEMCRVCLQCSFDGLAMPLDTSDDDAKLMFGKFYDATAEAGELLMKQKRPRQPLMKVSVDRWAFGVGFIQERSHSIFLSSELAIVSSAMECFGGADQQIVDRW
jgi:hypothetical protein